MRTVSLCAALLALCAHGQGVCLPGTVVTPSTSSSITTSGASTGGTYWYDAGAPFIYANEPVRNPDGGALVVVGRSTANSYGDVKPGLVLAGDGYPSGLNLSPSLSFAGGNRDDRVGAIYYAQASSGATVSGMNFWAGGSYGAAFGFAVNSSPGQSATLLGDWSTARFGLNTPIRIGSAGVLIASSMEGTFTVSAGSLAAQACEYPAVSAAATGCLPNAQCSVGRPPGQPSGIVHNCWISDNNAAVLQLCNVTASPVTKTASSTYTARCWNR